MDIENRRGSDSEHTARTVQRWGGLASFLMALALVVAPFIYLTGNLRDPWGPFFYTLADLLSGPVWAASLVTTVFALRERIGERAPRRMALALLAAMAAATAILSVALIRSANRQYHLLHPELHLESSVTVLTVWGTLVAGMTGVAWHLLGWVFLLIASAAWTSRSLPRGLGLLYLAAGAVALVVYLLPELEGLAAILLVVASIWQGILFWRAARE